MHACNAYFHEILTMYRVVYVPEGIECLHQWVWPGRHIRFKKLLASTVSAWQKIRVCVQLVMHFAMQK